MTARHPAVVAALRHFDHGHLPEPLRTTSARFHELAHALVDQDVTGDVPELTLALHRLTEAKDWAVRAVRAATGGSPATEHDRTTPNTGEPL
jgi:hypothetical protein